MKLKWITNPDGNPDPLLTITSATVAVILVKFMFSEMTFGAISFGGLDAGVIAALLTPTLGSMVANRHFSRIAKQPTKKVKSDVQKGS